MTKNQLTDKRKFYTNSTISLGSQFSSQGKNLSFLWKRRHYIKSLADGQAVNTHYQYLCSPLDQNCYLDVEITTQNKGTQHRTFGPIQLQGKLTLIALPNVFETRVILNKNVPYQTVICFPSHQTEMFIIKIQGQSMSFSSQYICNQRWRNITPSQTDPNVLLLNIKPIKTQFLKFIKNLMIPVHFGDTLKIMFQDRFNRDVFLLRVIEWGPSFDKVSENIQTVEKESFNINKAISKKQDPRTVVEELSLDRSKSDIKDDVSVDIKVMEDIYDVLYSPANGTPRKQYNDNFYRDQLKEGNGDSKKTIGTIKKEKRRGSQGQRKDGTALIEGSFGYASTKKDLGHEVNPNLYNTSRPDIRYTRSNTKKQVNNQLVEILLEDPKKIQNLINMNQELIQENQRLKKENALLAQQRQKYCGIKYIRSPNNLNPQSDSNYLQVGCRQFQQRKNLFSPGIWNMPLTPTSISTAIQTTQVSHLREMIEEMSKRIIRLQEKEHLQRKDKIVYDQPSMMLSKNTSSANDFSAKKQVNNKETNHYVKKQTTQLMPGTQNWTNNQFLPSSSYHNRKAPINSLAQQVNDNQGQYYGMKHPKTYQARNHTTKVSEKSQSYIKNQLQRPRLEQSQKCFKFSQTTNQNRKPLFLQYKNNSLNAYQRQNSKSPLRSPAKR